MSVLTAPRQVRLLKCALLAPGLDLRGETADDQRLLRDYGFDLMPFVQRINIFESIFQHTISGSITLLENVGLVEYVPIVGVETLALVFSVEDSQGNSKTFARTFRISKVHNCTYPRHEWRLYTMEFVTNEFVRSVSSRICRAYTNVSCKDAIEDILKRDLGVDGPWPSPRIENTFGKIDVVIPNYPPLKAINYFSMLAQTEVGHESNFLFFETLDGFHFTSIRKLIQTQTPTRTYQANPGQITGAEHVNDATVRNSLMRIEQDQTFDLLHDIASGTLRSQMVHFDLLARRVEHADDSRYSDTFKRTTHLDKYPLYPNNFDRSIGKNVRLFTVPSNFWTAKSGYIKGKGEEPVEQRLRESIVLRNRQLREIQHLQTLLDVPGAPDVRAGSIVTVNYPSTRPLESKDVAINVPVLERGTPYYSGAHLVTSVQHILALTDGAQMQYRMNLRVCRDSLSAPLYGTTSTKD